MKIWLVFAAAVGWASDYDDGVRAYREGHYAEACAEFERQLEDAVDDDDARSTLHYDMALCALRAGQLDRCEAAAEASSEGGDPEFVALRNFLIGNVAYARCEQVEMLALRPEAEPFLLEQALEHVEQACESWRAAALGRPDWPAARRNLERALVKRAKLENIQREREEQKQETPPEELPEPPPPEPEAPRHDVQEDAQEELGLLSPEELTQMLQRLDRNQEEKRALRRLDREKGRGRVERDW